MLIHIAGYRFFSLENPEKLREPLLKFCRERDLKGSLLLAPEGVNLYLSGPQSNIREIQNYLHEQLKFPEIIYKETHSKKHAYSKMLVKVRNEIVTMGFPEIQAETQAAPTVDPKTFENWLNDKKEMFVLDTRNDYEVELGKFRTATHLDVEDFREFAEKAADIPDSIRNTPVVMYCTGGIRCEKASARLIHQLGFKEVYQLKGGILNYFRECGDSHWEGECFVFDYRVGLNGKLEETDTEMCFACQWPVTAGKKKQGPYKTGEYCPKCHGQKNQMAGKAE